MAYCVAADDEALAGRCANCEIQLVNHLGRCAPGPRGERPAVLRQRGSHLKAPSAEDVERRIIVLDQLEAPLPQSRDVVGHFLQNLWHSWIEERAVARQAP